MLQYDLKIEVASLITMAIIMLNLFWDRGVDSRRNQHFRGIVFVSFFSIAITIITTYTSMHFKEFPLWIVELFKVLYYMLLPSSAVVVFLYAVSLRKVKTSSLSINKISLVLLLPYIIYILFVLSNYWFHGFFSISPTLGYVRGPLYQVPYPVSFFYILGIFIVAIISRQETNRGIWFILCISMVIITLIVMCQLFVSTIIFSGFATVTGVLLIFLYVQNVTKATDSLTGLFNRDRFTYTLTKFIKLRFKMFRSDREVKIFSLVVFSLRNMKAINERFGLVYGNGIIEGVGKYFKKAFHPHVVYRYSGDEFAILINEPEETLNVMLEEIANRFDYPYKIDEFTTEINLSVVYARVDFPTFGKDARTLLTALDYSISSLKKGLITSNFMHDISIFNTMSRRNKIIERLKAAIKNDGFEVHYQAIYSTKEKKFTGAEALIRMKDNIVDPIYPNEFIPLAEETGLIIEITYKIIENVCKDLRSLIDSHCNNVDITSVSINFPYTQFLEHDMVSNMMSILQRYDISPSWIKIEITERALIDETVLIHNIMTEMKEEGFVFELDDFGIDYSNMSMVLDLPVDIIKIDRSLVLIATATKTNQDFFRHFIKAIKITGRTLIVEGIEKKEQVDFFESCECEYIQGFFYARPLNFDDFVAFLLKKC